MDGSESRKRHIYSAATCGLVGEDCETLDHPSLQTELAPIARTPAPDKLKLPFEARQRESRILTDQEMDDIIAQEALRAPLPKSPSMRSHRPFSLRRSISTARQSQFSVNVRPRPASADWSTLPRCNTSDDLVSRMPGDRSSFRASSYTAIPRIDASIRALPKVPTRNMQLDYPPTPDAKLNQQVETQGAPMTSPYYNVPTVRSDMSPDRLKRKHHQHKRNLSSVVIDNLRKFVLKKPVETRFEEDPISNQQNPPTELMDQSHLPKTRHFSLEAHVLETGRPGTAASHTRANTLTPNTPDSISEGPHRMPRDLAFTAHPPERLSTNTTSTLVSSTRLSAPYSPASTAVSEPASPAAFHTGRSNILKRHFVVSKRTLNDIIARQQNRIVDLSMQNNSLVGQLDELRQDVMLLQQRIFEGAKRESTYTEGWVDEE